MMIVALPQLVWVRHFVFYLSFATNPLRIAMSKFARTSASNVDKVPQRQWEPCVMDICCRTVAGSADLGTEAGEVYRFVGCRRHVCEMFVCDMFVTPQCDLCPLHPLLQVKCEGPCRVPLGKDKVYAVCTFCGTVQPGDRRWEAGCSGCIYMLHV